MTRALVVAEHDAAELSPATLNVIGAARALEPARIDVLLIASDSGALAEAAASLAGIDTVISVDRDENWPCLAAVWAPQVAAVAADYSHVLTPATTFGKDLLPRVAALLGVGMLSDVTGMAGPWRFERPVYAGNAIVRVAADPDRIVCATIRPTAFEAVGVGGRAAIEARTVDVPIPTHTRFVERRQGSQSGPDLQTASRVVAGGRGLGGSEGLELLRRLAATLDAAVGASRAAVDAGWVPNDLQVGQTGKIIAPELYLAVGISGAIQHLTGIKDAGTIVAINSDAEAPICQLADIVLEADLFSALPELIAGLESRRMTER